MNAITLFFYIFYSYYKDHKPFVCTETTVTFCKNILLLVVTTATTPSFLKERLRTPWDNCNHSFQLVQRPISPVNIKRAPFMSRAVACFNGTYIKPQNILVCGAAKDEFIF